MICALTIAGKGGADSEPKIEIGVDFCGRQRNWEEACLLEQAERPGRGNCLSTTLSLYLVEDVV